MHIYSNICNKLHRPMIHSINSKGGALQPDPTYLINLEKQKFKTYIPPQNIFFFKANAKYSYPYT